MRQRLDVLRAVLAQQTKFVVPSGSNLLNILGIDDLRAAAVPPAPPAPQSPTSHPQAIAPPRKVTGPGQGPGY